ncbi:MAG: hypothetical protein ABI651_20575 [Verrucomicrobiota bacterium]
MKSGYFRAEYGARTLWDIRYFDIQLFLIQMPELKGPLHAAIDVARFLAPAVAGVNRLESLAGSFLLSAHGKPCA